MCRSRRVLYGSGRTAPETVRPGWPSRPDDTAKSRRDVDSYVFGLVFFESSLAAIPYIGAPSTPPFGRTDTIASLHQAAAHHFAQPRRPDVRSLTRCSLRLEFLKKRHSSGKGRSRYSETDLRPFSQEKRR